MPIIRDPLKIPQRDRVSFFQVGRGHVDIKDGAFVVIDKNGIREQIPIGSVSCVLLEPGTRISHEAIKVCAKVQCLVLWVGEDGSNLYSAGRPGGARSDRLLYQAKVSLDKKARLKVVRKMYEMRFGEPAPESRSVEQLRGIEGARVKKIYQDLARDHGIPWRGRKYDRKNWKGTDAINRSLSVATSTLYGVTEAAILASGYSPAIGFIHTGNSSSFVFDIADIIKFNTVIPITFRVAKKSYAVERDTRIECRRVFKQTRLLSKLIPLIDSVIDSGGVEAPASLLPGQKKPAYLDPKWEP